MITQRKWHPVPTTVIENLVEHHRAGTLDALAENNPDTLALLQQLKATGHFAHDAAGWRPTARADRTVDIDTTGIKSGPQGSNVAKPANLTPAERRQYEMR